MPILYRAQWCAVRTLQMLRAIERPHLSLSQGAFGSDMNIRVECYAGYRGEETPRALYLGEQRVEVKEVLDRWLAPDHRYFKVQAEDNSIYILRHETESNDWTLTLFQAPGGWAQEELISGG